jgi:chloramphenicol O-acetyltransferase type A
MREVILFLIVAQKISFGKMMVSDTGQRTMSMSVHVHHGLMDGMHLGQFVDYFQEIMNQ